MDLETADKKYTRIMVVALLLVLPACGKYLPKAGAAWNQDILEESPPGPPKFQLGWKDGCHSGISVTGNLNHRQFYHYKQNSDLAQDHEYYTGWKIAYDHCQRHFFSYLGREYF
jgi:hypothetical protein